MDWMKDLAPFLPRGLLTDLQDASVLQNITEIRLRVGGRPLGCAGGRTWELDSNILTQQDMNRIAACMMEHTPAVRGQERSQGYLHLPGGYRAGICGIVRQEGGELRVQEVTSLCIRIRRRIPGCSREWLARIYPRGGSLQSCLVASPPGLGKTTLLADAAYQLGRGFDGREPLQTCVVDERGELGPAQVYEGYADVLSGMGKAQGIVTVLRAMAPQVILVDEIGSHEDAAALREALHCGVKVLASAHAASLRDLEGRASLQGISRLFSCRVILSGTPGRIAQFEQLS